MRIREITETRDRMFEYIKQVLPAWPDYVLRDWIYNLARGEHRAGGGNDPQDPTWGFNKETILHMIGSEGLSPQTKWVMVPNFEFKLENLHPDTQRRIRERAGGSVNPYSVPNDAERHATQAALAQKQGGVRKEPVIGKMTPQGFELIEGWHRTIQHFKMFPEGYRGPAWVATASQVEEALAESLSRVAFHYTRMLPALKILKNGEFELSSTLGSVEQSYAPKGKPYFLSTTRTRTGGYHQYVGDQGVLFVLDGDWFNRHYKSKPVDYWGNRDPAQSHHRPHEAEDRVFSADPTMPIDGVSAIHVYVGPDADDNLKARARQALIIAKRRGIPAYFYTDENAWRNFDARNQGDVKFLTGKEPSGGYVSTHKGYLIPWIELVTAKDKDQLSKKASQIRYGLSRDYDRHSLTQSLSTDLSNARKPSSGPDRQHAIKLIDFMRKNKLSSVGELVDALAAKWKSN